MFHKEEISTFMKKFLEIKFKMLKIKYQSFLFFFLYYKLWFYYGKHNHKIQFSELGLIDVHGH